MPRVYFVKKARKDHGRGIMKGDSYYWWQFRYSPIMKSKTRPRPSQLTQSEYLSQFYSTQESFQDTVESILRGIDGSFDSEDEFEEKVEEITSAISEAQSEVESMKDEIYDKKSNMEEYNLESTPAYEILESREQALEELENQLETAESGITDLDIESTTDDFQDVLDNISWDPEY
jgi:chromosome segregation ATPase